VIPTALSQALIADARWHAPKETGGVLLGYRDRCLSSVTELVGAGPGACRQRHRFDPDSAWQRERIAERYKRSGRTLCYLGDWHSHPLGGGPSALDRATARRIARALAARCPHPIMLVAVRDGGEWALRAYLYGRRGLRQIEVRVEER
jgi:integrative and conjugative element protein (TIGR02256 family)